MNRKEMSCYAVICGIDVGKSEHFAVALDQTCEPDRPLIRRAVSQDEDAIRLLLAECGMRGRTLVVVDQYDAFGALVVAIARDEGMDVAHISPARFQKVAETWGEDKTDARDAMIIADAARSTPRNVDPVPERSEAVARVRVLSGERDDAVAEMTRLYNRLHAIITRSCPALEQVLSKDRLHNKCELEMVAEYGGAKGLTAAGKAAVSGHLAKMPYQRTRGPKRAEEAFGAIGRQTVFAPGTEEMEAQARRLARRRQELRALVAELDGRIEELSALVPEVAVLTSVPGIGRVYAATIACEIGDVSRFPDANHLASYAGVAPVRHESGTSVRKRKKRKGGNRRLKNALIRSAKIASKIDPRAKAYYERKLAQHTDGNGSPSPGAARKALRALARRRVGVIFALLRDGSVYEPSHQNKAA